jgi:hypothetical protein
MLHMTAGEARTMNSHRLFPEGTTCAERLMREWEASSGILYGGGDDADSSWLRGVPPDCGGASAPAAALVRFYAEVGCCEDFSSPCHGSQASCRDVAEWKDGDGDGCRVYEETLIGGHICGNNSVQIQRLVTLADDAGRDAGSACCDCGGGNATIKDRCTDLAGWTDSDGHGCDTYTNPRHATCMAGTVGLYPVFSAAGRAAGFVERHRRCDGVSALGACCACGGGDWNFGGGPPRVHTTEPGTGKRDVYFGTSRDFGNNATCKKRTTSGSRSRRVDRGLTVGCGLLGTGLLVALTMRGMRAYFERGKAAVEVDVRLRFFAISRGGGVGGVGHIFLRWFVFVSCVCESHMR